jgi:hypothetical protein
VSAGAIGAWLALGLVSRDAAAQVSGQHQDAAVEAAPAAPPGIAGLPLPVELKALPADPAGLCEDKPGGPAWLDRMQSGLYRTMCLAAARFDGFFGSARFNDEYQSTNGSLSVGTLWDQRDGFDPALRFRLRMKLPQLSNRFNVFIGRVDPVGHVTEMRDDFDTLPRQFGQQEDDAVLVGLDYSQPTHGKGYFDFDVGTELSLPLDPYVKARYRIAVPFFERNVLRLRETVFWQQSEQAGFTSRIDLERLLAEQFLVRWTGSGTWSQNTEGVEWLSSVTLFQNLGNGRALAYQVGASGESDAEVPLKDYGFRLIFRHRIFREWLILELRSSLTWPRETLLESRERNIGVGAAVEMQFGGREQQ